MPIGFRMNELRALGADGCKRYRTNESTQWYPGELVKVVNNVVQKIADTDKPTHLFVALETPKGAAEPAIENRSTAEQEFALVKPIGGDLIELRANITPYLNNFEVSANANAAEVVFDDAAGNGALVGATVYSNDLDEHATVTADVKVSSTHTLTVEPAFSRPLTTGDKIKLVPFSAGFTAIKPLISNPGLGNGALGVSTTVAGATGGHLKAQEVDLGNKYVGGPTVVVSVPDSE